MTKVLAEDLEGASESAPFCLKWTGGTHRFEAESLSVDVVISGQAGKKFTLNDVRTVGDLQLPT